MKTDEKRTFSTPHCRFCFKGSSTKSKLGSVCVCVLHFFITSKTSFNLFSSTFTAYWKVIFRSRVILRRNVYVRLWNIYELTLTCPWVRFKVERVSYYGNRLCQSCLELSASLVAVNLQEITVNFSRE